MMDYAGFTGDLIKSVGDGSYITPASGLQKQAFLSGSNLAPNAAIKNGIDATAGLAGFDPGKLIGTDLSKYYNPYEQQVVDTTYNDANRFLDERLNSLNGNATMARAFGGARDGVMRGVATGETARNLASTLAGVRAQGMDWARQGAMYDIDNGMKGAQFRLGAANQLANLGLAGDANSRSMIDMQARLGEQERAIQDETNPTKARAMMLALYGGLLGQVPSALIGATTNSTAASTGKSSGSSFGIGWSPKGGISFGG